MCTRPDRPHSEREREKEGGGRERGGRGRERESRYSNLGNFQIGHVHHHKLTVNTDDDRDDSLRAMFDSEFHFVWDSGWILGVIITAKPSLLSRIVSL